MPFHRFSAAVCAAAALALGAAAAPSAAASPASAPVIHESFTVLPCPGHPTTTVQIEGCAEHKILARDKTIDALNTKIFGRLDKVGRTTFIRANSDWLSYRKDACSSVASIYAGGTIQPIAFDNCVVSVDSSHVGELEAMLVALSPAG